jgi:hypothetical protein
MRDQSELFDAAVEPTNFDFVPWNIMTSAGRRPKLQVPSVNARDPKTLHQLSAWLDCGYTNNQAEGNWYLYQDGRTLLEFSR